MLEEVKVHLTGSIEIFGKYMQEFPKDDGRTAARYEQYEKRDKQSP